MSGFLKSIETEAGQTIGIIRQNGQVEDCLLVAEGEVGGAPLSVARYVDAGTTVPLANQNGSEGAPFSTIAAGLLAVANLGGNFGCLLIMPADYSGEGVLQWVGTQALMLKGYLAGVPFPDAFAGPNPQVQLPSITATNPVDLYLDNVTSAIPTQFNGFNNISGVGCELQTVLTAGNLSLRDSFLLGSIGIGGSLRLWNCECTTDSSWNIAGTGCELIGTKIIAFTAASIVFGGAPGLVTVDDYSNFYFVGLGPIPITNGAKLVAADVTP